MADDFGEVVKDLNFLLKLLEFCLCLAGCIMWYVAVGTAAKSLPWPQYDAVPVAVCGYGAVLVCMLITYIFDETPLLMEMCLTMFGAITHLIACIIIFIFYADNKSTMNDRAAFSWVMTGVLCACCCVCCIADGIVKWYYKDD